MPAYKDKNNGTWYIKFQILDDKGKSKQKLKRGFKLKREALEWERDFLLNHQGNISMTFSKFLDIYKADTYPQLRLKTQLTKNYRHKRILNIFNDTPLKDITPKDIKKWQNSLIADKLSSRYIQEIQNEFSTILNHAVKYYGLKENPIHKVGSVKVPNELVEDMRFWTLDEYKQVYKHIDNIKAKTAINLLYWTGMRKGELYALTWENIDFENKLIKVNRSLQHIHGKDIITQTKTYENRDIRLPNFVIDELIEYQSKCYNITPKDLAFPWEKRFIENGIKKGTEGANKAIKELNAISDIKIPLINKIHVHGLRHSHASYLINHNVNIILISKRLGHKNPSITLDTYSHFYPSADDDLLKMMNEEDI